MPNGSIDPNFDYISEIANSAGAQWSTIAQARTDAIAVHALLRDSFRKFSSDDTDLVVFGSLARQEWTSGSDVDWTLLVDGQASIEHRIAARQIEQALAGLQYNGTKLNAPGTEGIFGKMAFSHDIIHHIGGQADTNRNTTQRILLLLEAASLREPKGVGPCERVVRQILQRYLATDSNFHSLADKESRIPRFLLNDIVRYWRTMCVDFAFKDWEQAGKKWAIRNIKLRMSRKLLFVAGLFPVFSCFHNNTLRRSETNQDYLLLLQAHLSNFVNSTPLNIVIWTLTNIGLNNHCVELVTTYDAFLTRINNREIRSRLGELEETAVYTDQMFLECRHISHQFQAVLTDICFKTDSPLREFTLEYGVF